jgi:hypothetical protein
MQMQEGDLVIMASDGIACDFEDAAALAAMVGGREEEPLSALCEHVLDACDKRLASQPVFYKEDDRSICIIRIEAYRRNREENS